MHHTKIFLFSVLSIACFQLAPAASPKEVLEEFQACIKHEPERARAFIAKFPDLPPQVVGFMQEKVTKHIRRIESGDSPFKILDGKVDGDYAVVVIKEEAQDKTEDYDPIFLIQQGGQWKIFPKFSSWKIDKNVIKNEDILLRLEKWFEAEKLKLKSLPKP